MCEYHRNLAVKRESDVNMEALEAAERDKPRLRVVVEKTQSLQGKTADAANAVLETKPGEEDVVKGDAVEELPTLADLALFVKGEKSLPRGKKGADKRVRAGFLRDYMVLANKVLGLSLPTSVTNKNKSEVRLSLWQALQSRGVSGEDSFNHIPRSVRG
ncbi:hypothetical protein JKY72_00695 [Candidatus Gracilibacteria bacterium]|nr:hypothetical protein [Candidatus Gracilibacteria bacterium]